MYDSVSVSYRSFVFDPDGGGYYAIKTGGNAMEVGNGGRRKVKKSPADEFETDDWIFKLPETSALAFAKLFFRFGIHRNG